MAHEGKKAYSETFELVCRREADRPNVIWQADHSLLDILIHCETEKPVKDVKPWLTIIIDDHSRAIGSGQLMARRIMPARLDDLVPVAQVLV